MYNILIICLIGIIIGMLMGLTGNLFFGFVIVLFKYLDVGDYKTIIGTTLYVMMFPLAIGSTIEFYKAKKINLLVGNLLLITLIIGSYFGSKIILYDAFKISEKQIKYLSGVLAVLTGILFFMQAEKLI